MCLTRYRYSDQQLLSEKVSDVSESAEFAKLWQSRILQYTQCLLYYLDVYRDRFTVWILQFLLKNCTNSPVVLAILFIYEFQS